MVFSDLNYMYIVSKGMWKNVLSVFITPPMNPRSTALEVSTLIITPPMVQWFQRWKLKTDNTFLTSLGLLLLLYISDQQKTKTFGWSSTRRISSSSHWKLTYSCHDIAEKLLSRSTRDTLSWFRVNQSLLYLHNVACLAKKQHIPISLSLVWPDRVRAHDLPKKDVVRF
jgi:hypothetical protein